MHVVKSMLLATTIAGMTILPLQAQTNTLSLVLFEDSTGLEASARDIQQTWQALRQMGTDEFLGGFVGSFRLDEAAMISGALTIGATEFDNFLRSGQLSNGLSDVGDALSANMGEAAGIDLSTFVGSFTAGGGSSGTSALPFTQASAQGGATAAGGICDPAVASDLVAVGKKHVEMMRQAGLGDEFGMSQIGQINSPSGSGTGFASLGCLDKLFQNSGSDIFFKPPSLGNLMGQLQNWTCPEIPGVAEQVMGGFGDLSTFDTASMGGFYPHKTYGEANAGQFSFNGGGMQATIETFGEEFARLETVSAEDIRQKTDLRRLFQ